MFTGCTIDLVLLLDDSSSLNNDSRHQLLDFASSIVDAIDVGVTQARVGVIQFATDARVEFYLDTFTTKADVIAAIQSLPTQSGDSKHQLFLAHCFDLT